MALQAFTDNAAETSDAILAAHADSGIALSSDIFYNITAQIKFARNYVQDAGNSATSTAGLWFSSVMLARIDMVLEDVVVVDTRSRAAASGFNFIKVIGSTLGRGSFTLRRVSMTNVAVARGESPQAPQLFSKNLRNELHFHPLTAAAPFF